MKKRKGASEQVFPSAFRMAGKSDFNDKIKGKKKKINEKVK